jgi:AraC-like DNA-binding protein
MIYISLTLTILISVILLLHHWEHNKGVVYLVILLLAAPIRPLMFYLINNVTDTVLFAQLFLHLDPLSCLIGPMVLYYFRSLVNGKLVLDWALLLHLIPALLILLNTLPYYSIPLSEKVQFLKEVQARHLPTENVFPSLLFPYSWHKIILPVFNYSYGFISLGYMLKIRKKAKGYVKIKILFLLTRVAWVIGIYFASLFFFILYSTLSNIKNAPISFTHDAYRFSSFMYYFSLVLPISFLLMPKVLYGEKQKYSPLESFWARIKQFFTHPYPEHDKPKSESEAVERIVSYLEKDKPYLKEDFSQHDLAIALNIPQKHITDYFNKQLKVSFPLYRNTLRIRHATELFQKGAHLTNSIEGIGALSGFKSKSTFFAAFKIAHGITPVDWIKKHL